MVHVMYHVLNDDHLHHMLAHQLWKDRLIHVNDDMQLHDAQPTVHCESERENNKQQTTSRTDIQDDDE